MTHLLLIVIYIGSLAMPAVFELIARHVNIALSPAFLLLLLVLMFVIYERMENS